jgi:hypothetical protein
VYLSQSNASSSEVTVPELIYAFKDSFKNFKNFESIGELFVRAPI